MTSDIAVVDAPIQGILETIKHREVEVVQAEVGIPPHLQYKIKTGSTGKGQSRKDVYKVGLTSDGYDHINRVAGVQIVAPKFVHDDEGRQVLNPIHRKDYIYLRLVGIWWNDIGQMVAYAEDLEVDFLMQYQEARLNARWYTGEYPNRETHTPELVLGKDANGQVLFNEDGTPVHKLILPEAEELKALQRLYNLRNMGLRYAWTVAKTRILKVATGIKTLPIDEPRAVKVKVYGFRDGLTPQQREERAKQDQEAIFGKALTHGATLSDAELTEAGLDAAEIVAVEGEGAIETTTAEFDVDEIDEVIAEARGVDKEE
jgi:hypothetical protein